MPMILILFALLILMSTAPANAAFSAHPAAPRCASCLGVQEIQQLDCNALTQVHQYGGCGGFCRNFAQAWGGASQAAIAQCINNCNHQLAQCAGGGGGGGGAAQPNCQWYSKGDISKYICRIY